MKLLALPKNNGTLMMIATGFSCKGVRTYGRF